MKKIFLICVLLFAHSVSAAEVESKILRELENFGQRLQVIQDQEGMDAAQTAFEDQMQLNLAKFKSAVEMIARSLSEEELMLIIQKWEQSSDNEVELQILKDRSISAREKYIQYQMMTYSNALKEDFSILKKAAFEKGYEKVFQDLANQFRSRGREESRRAGFIVLSTFLFLTVVEFVVLIPAPLVYYMAPLPTFFLGWLIWDYLTSPPQKTTDFLTPPDFNSNRYRLIQD